MHVPLGKYILGVRDAVGAAQEKATLKCFNGAMFKVQILSFGGF